MRIKGSLFTRGIIVIMTVLMVLLFAVAVIAAENTEPKRITNEYRVVPPNPAQKMSTVLIKVEEFKDARPSAEIQGAGSGFMTQESSEAMSTDTLTGALQRVLAKELAATAGIKAEAGGAKKSDYVLKGTVTHFIVTKERELVNLLPYVSNVTNLIVGEPIYHTAEIQVSLVNQATGKVAYDSSYTTYFETKQTPGVMGVRNLTPYQTIEREIHVLMDRMATEIVLDLHGVLEKRGEAFEIKRPPIREAEDYYWEELDKKQMKGNEGWASSD